MTFAFRACRRVGLALLGFIVLPAQPGAPAQSSSSSAFELSLADGTAVGLDFSATPALTGCRRLLAGEGYQQWECSDYALELSVRHLPQASLIGFSLKHLDGIPFLLHEQSVRVAVPRLAGDALWTFNRQDARSIMETHLSRPWVYFSAANRGIPLAVLVDQQGTTRLALGLLEQDHIVLLRGETSANNKDYVLSLRQADNAFTELLEGTLYVSRHAESWFQTARNYTAEVDRHRNYVPLEIPESALNPTFDSWYWSEDRINQEMTWNLAQISRELGFKTYLIDAGWDTHAGEYVKGLKGSTGDYRPPLESFPDFSGLLDDIRNLLGMKVMLWMQQYALGRHSVYYPEIGSALTAIGDAENGGLAETPFLCPRTHAAQEHLIYLFERVLDDYSPDALWFDWQDEIPPFCTAPHYHEYERFGEGYNASQQAILETIRQRSTDLFIDMRWPFANLNNKPYTHLWQPIDSAGDYEAMRLQAITMRPFSSGVVMGTDEMYWDPEISDTEAARFMAAVVFTGVPYFGPNLLAEPTSRTEMLKAWIRFYESHKQELVGGDFAPYGDRDRPDQYIESPEAAFIYYGNRYPGPVPLTGTADTIFLVNNSAASGIDLTVTGLRPGRYRIEISDPYLRNPERYFTRYLNSKPRLRFDVPVGCLLTLTRIP